MAGLTFKHKSSVEYGRQYFRTAQGLVHFRTSQPAAENAQRPQNDTPVVLLHMSASSSKSCLALMQHLSALGYSCFAPDMPGFGESDDPKDVPSSIAWYSNLYMSVFAGLPSFNRGCHIIGHHSGAVIGTDLAANHGDFVQSLTLVGPAIMSAEQRRHWAESTLVPFNQPVEDSSHLATTWNYLVEMGIPKDDLVLLQRETLDHARAWQGRLQIYACVWAYDCGEALKSIPKECKIAALCAEDDVLWPYFENVELVRDGVKKGKIAGANFGPDLGTQDISREFLALVET